MRAIAVSSSAMKASPASALRPKYHWRAARASMMARSALAFKNSTARFGPRNRRDDPGVQFMDALGDLLGPSGFSILVNVLVEALQQRGGERRPCLRRQLERLLQKPARIWRHAVDF